MLCESCAEPISHVDYDYLAENVRYDDPDVYIVHISHADVQGCAIMEEIERHGELKLVKVAE